MILTQPHIPLLSLSISATSPSHPRPIKKTKKQTTTATNKQTENNKQTVKNRSSSKQENKTKTENMFKSRSLWQTFWLGKIRTDGSQRESDRQNIVEHAATSTPNSSALKNTRSQHHHRQRDGPRQTNNDSCKCDPLPSKLGTPHVRVVVFVKHRLACLCSSTALTAGSGALAALLIC